MRRRQFITLLGGGAAWPLAASAQQRAQIRRIGIMLSGRETDSEMQSRVRALRDGLSALGWIEGGSCTFEYRSGIDAFASRADGGLLAAADPGGVLNRAAIIAAAARHRLPAVYPFRFFVKEGGLASY